MTFVSVAKQCIETAFHISDSEIGDVPDLQTVFKSQSQVITRLLSHYYRKNLIF